MNLNNEGVFLQKKTSFVSKILPRKSMQPYSRFYYSYWRYFDIMFALNTYIDEKYNNNIMK